MDKIETIRSKLPDKVQNIPQLQKPEIRSKMNVFERALEDEIKKLILSSSSKSCDLDPIPTSMLKKRVEKKPLLKKTYLPKNELKNYRPVSNLSFIFKKPTGNIILQNRLC